MSNLTVSEIMKDSFKFTFKNFLTVLGFGIVLSCIAFCEHYMTVFAPSHPVISIILVILLFFVSIVEAGFCYRIYANTIHDLDRIHFKRFKEIIHHGSVDLVITIIYAIIMAICDQILILFLQVTTFSLVLNLIIVFVLFFVSNFVNVWWFLSLLNLAYNDGKFKSAFNFREINRIIKRMSFSKYVFIFFGCLFADLLLALNMFELFIDIPSFDIWLIVINLIITPFIVIFLKRFTAIASLKN